MLLKQFVNLKKKIAAACGGNKGNGISKEEMRWFSPLVVLRKFNWRRMKLLQDKKPEHQIAIHFTNSEIITLKWRRNELITQAEVMALPWQNTLALDYQIKNMSELSRVLQPLLINTHNTNLSLFLPDSLVIHKKIRLPIALTANDILRYINLESERYFGLQATSLCYDFISLLSDDKQQEVLIYAAKQDTILPWQRLANRLGISLKAIHVVSLSIIVALQKIITEPDFIFLHKEAHQLLLGLVLAGRLHYFRQFVDENEKLLQEWPRLNAYNALALQLSVYCSGEIQADLELDDMTRLITVDAYLPFSSKYLVCMGMME